MFPMHFNLLRSSSHWDLTSQLCSGGFPPLFQGLCACLSMCSSENSFTSCWLGGKVWVTNLNETATHKTLDKKPTSFWLPKNNVWINDPWFPKIWTQFFKKPIGPGSEIRFWWPRWTPALDWSEVSRTNDSCNTWGWLKKAIQAQIWVIMLLKHSGFE